MIWQRNGQWFYTCVEHSYFEGAYRLEAEATTGLWKHIERRHR